MYSVDGNCVGAGTSPPTRDEATASSDSESRPSKAHPATTLRTRLGRKKWFRIRYIHGQEEWGCSRWFPAGVSAARRYRELRIRQAEAHRIGPAFSGRATE